MVGVDLFQWMAMVGVRVKAKVGEPHVVAHH